MVEAESLSGRSHSKSVPSGKLSTNFLAEQIASLTAAKCLTEADDRTAHVAFLTDCKSVLGKKMSMRKMPQHTINAQVQNANRLPLQTS